MINTGRKGKIMENKLIKKLDVIVRDIRKNPIHMVKFKERIINNSKQKQSVQLDPNKPSISIRKENNFFDDDENITIYLDFLTEQFFPWNTTKTPLKERCKKAKLHQHTHEFFEFYYLHSGTCHIYVDESEFILQPGAIWILNTQLAHNVVLDDETTNLVNILVRKSTFMDSLINMLDTDNLLYQFFVNSIYSPVAQPKYISCQLEEDCDLLFFLYKLLSTYLTQEPNWQSMMKAVLSGFLLELSSLYQKNKVIQSNTKVLNILDLLSYINSHFMTVTLTELSDKFHYSANYISRFISKQTGHGFAETVNKMKLNKAKEMLANSDFSTETIAATLGYSDRRSFERAFKNVFQITPKQYRDQIA